MPEIRIEVESRTYTKLVAVSVLTETAINDLVSEWILVYLESYLHNIA